MKMILAVTVLALSASAWAQTNKKMSPPPAPRTTNVTSFPTYSAPTSSQNEITGYLGLAAGAFNLGVTYIRPTADFGFGGYFFYQTSKDKNNNPVVNQLMSFGGLVKVNLVDSHKVRVYVAPGFGLSMVKDVLGTSSTGATTKSDENLIGPSLRMGVQFRTISTFLIGLERSQIANWLNDSVTYGGTAEYYQVAGTFEF